MLVTVSDKKLAIDSDNNGIANYYQADVVTAGDYAPFGMALVGRKFTQTNSSYRYGFNGKEKDKDAGEGIQDYGMRIYDSRLGKFLSVDPYYKNFPFYSPYMFAGNSPITYVDENGGYKINGKIKAKYPKIYKYLSQNLGKEMLASSLVAHGFKLLNPKLTSDNLTEIFTNGSGPTINSMKEPDDIFGDDVTGKYVNKEDEGDGQKRQININEKVFVYVEGILKSKKSTKEEKTRALFLLKTFITHETGHDAERMTGGLNADGTPKMIHETKESREKQKLDLNIVEAGYELTEYVFGIPVFPQFKNQGKKELVPGIKLKSDGNKIEVLDDIIKKLNGSDAGKQTLPSVPDDKSTPVVK